VYSIPGGGTIKFHFASPEGEGSIPLSVAPAANGAWRRDRPRRKRARS
jgi:hypothetical protein